MASPNTLAMNASIPKPTPILLKEGNPNEEKHKERIFNKMVRGNTRGKRNSFRKLAELVVSGKIKF